MSSWTAIKRVAVASSTAATATTTATPMARRHALAQLQARVFDRLPPIAPPSSTATSASADGSMHASASAQNNPRRVTDALRVRTADEVLVRASQAERIANHWQVDDVWQWPRAPTASAPWRHLKHESIHAKIQALGARGKGPAARKAAGGSGASGGKKKRK